MTGRLSAVGLSYATVNDPQFQLPEHPATVPGVVLAWLGDELLVEGTGDRRTLSGRSARAILPGLLPLLDGTRDLAELAAATGEPAPRLRAVLLMLFSCGLLQEGPPPAVPTPRATLLARLRDTTRVNRHAGEALGRLGRARVAVWADGPFGDLVRASLAAEGIATVAGWPPGGLTPPGEEAPPDLAVIWAQEAAAAAAAAAGARAAGVPVLLTGVSAGGLFLGPYSATDYGACPDCSLSQTALAGPAAAQAPLAMLADLVTVEAVALLSRVGVPLSLRGQTIIDPAAPGHRAPEFLPPRPGCPVCGDPKVELRDAPLAYRYETAVAFPPRRLVNPRDHQHHFEPANTALQFDAKRFPGRPVTSLPAGFAADGLTSAGPRPGEVTLERLSTVLLACCGLKQPPGAGAKVLRWAPTGGNLGSPAAYLIARGVPGLAPGGYAYLPEAHGLAQLSDVLPPGWEDRPEPATLVITAALARVAKKYHAFAYRVVHLDTGVALAHLLLACRWAGLPFVNSPAWDDAALAAALGVPLDPEPVTAVVRLGVTDA